MSSTEKPEKPEMPAGLRAGTRGSPKVPVDPERPPIVHKIFRLLDARPDITYGRAAEAAGVSKNTLTAWKSPGARADAGSEPSARAAFALARLLGVTVEYLCDDSLSEPPPRDSAAFLAGTLAERLSRLRDEMVALRAEANRVASEYRGVGGEITGLLADLHAIVAPPGTRVVATPIEDDPPPSPRDPDNGRGGRIGFEEGGSGPSGSAPAAEANGGRAGGGR